MNIKELYRFLKLANAEDIIQSALEVKEEPPVKGNGNAEFLPDMTQEEMEEYIHQEERGWNRFYKKLGFK